jgi:hypothetical protein
VVAGGHDGQQRDGRMRHHDGAATCALDGHEADAHHERPPEVQRRHGGELVGDRSPRIAIVDARAELVERVDEAPGHPRGSEGEPHVDRERGHRDQYEPRADEPIRIRVAHVRPHQEGDRQREVHADVVAVEDVDDRLAAEDPSLHGTLAEDSRSALEVDHATGVGHGLVGGVTGEHPTGSVQHEHGGDHRELDQDRAGAAMVGQARGVAHHRHVHRVNASQTSLPTSTMYP